MRLIITIAFLFAFKVAFSQKTINTAEYGQLEFKVLDYGTAKVEGRTSDKLNSSPTGDHGWLTDFQITQTTDSVKAQPKANFGLVYIVNSKDTVDINVEIEWIYPKRITNDKGEIFKKVRYPTKRPTNTQSASSYTIDEPYELIKGDWQVNIYISKQRVCSKIFILY